MDEFLLKYLKQHKIAYKVHRHKSVFTVKESKSLDLPLSGIFHTKNLFLKDENKNYYLVCMNANKKLDTKKLKEYFRVKKLSFANPDELKFHLNLLPGSVSIFGMIYAKEVVLVLDNEILKSEKVGFHPNVNTATLELTISELKKFLETLNAKKIFLNL